MRRLLKFLAVSVLAMVSVGIAFAGPSDASGTRARFLATSLTGAEEVPGPGDPDGRGFAVMVVQPRHDRICYFVGVRGIEPATAAHIHRGPVGMAGPVVVTLEAPTDGHSAACTTADPALVDELVATPEQFYVNVHNVDFPAGALRGQLGD